MLASWFLETWKGNATSSALVATELSIPKLFFGVQTKVKWKPNHKTRKRQNAKEPNGCEPSFVNPGLVESSGCHRTPAALRISGRRRGRACDRPVLDSQPAPMKYCWELHIHQPQFINRGVLFPSSGESSLVKENTPLVTVGLINMRATLGLNNNTNLPLKIHLVLKSTRI